MSKIEHPHSQKVVWLWKYRPCTKGLHDEILDPLVTRLSGKKFKSVLACLKERPGESFFFGQPDFPSAASRPPNLARVGVRDVSIFAEILLPSPRNLTQSNIDYSRNIKDM